MDDESFLMEEKSLLSFKSACENFDDDVTTTLSTFSKAQVPSYSWLPCYLRDKIAESCENVKTRHGYPVVDWLRQIRLCSDSLESGIPVKIYPNGRYNNLSSQDDDDDEDLSIIESLKLSKKYYDLYEQDSFMDTDNVDSITSEMTQEGVLIPAENEKKISTFKNKEIKLLSVSDDEFTYDDSENSSCPLVTLNRVSLNLSFNKSVMKLKNSVCCVHLVQDENGFFTMSNNQQQDSEFYDNEFDDNLNKNNQFSSHFKDVEFVDDDSKALKICQTFFEQSKLSNQDDNNYCQDNLKENISDSVSIDSCGTISRIFKNVFDPRDTDYDSFDESQSPILPDADENNMKLDFDKLNDNLNFKDEKNIIFWNPIFNNESIQELVTSSEMLYESCENFERNINIENESASKIGDSDYRSFESDSSNFQKWMVEDDCDLSNDFYRDVGEEIADEFRRRKGSNASDILMWKKNLIQQVLNDDDDDDCQQVI